nr:MAG: replication associated protein [Cressdnaviricota sp.]
MKSETSEILESEGDGNTKHPPHTIKKPIQLMNYCFTLNNYNSEDISEIEKVFKSISKKYIFQEETGKEGTHHLQGSVWLKKKMRFTEFKLNKKIHWEKMRNEIASEEYCGKAETRTGEIFKWGFPKKLNIIENLKPWQLKIEKIYLSEPDDRKIYWFWESKGGIGKSSFVKYLVYNYKCLFCDGGRKSDLINLVFNNDMDSCRCVIWDLPRNTGNKISYDTIESVKNGMVCNTKYETGIKLFNSPHIFVFSNEPPEEDKMSSDRWIIEELE